MKKNWRKVIQSKEFNIKESGRYNVSVLINHHQDFEKMLSIVVRSLMDVQWNTKQEGDYIHRERGGANFNQ